MLTEIQKIILTCCLGPEDPGAFKRARNAERQATYRGRHPESVKAARKEDKIRRPGAAKKAKKKWETNHPEEHRASCRRREARNHGVRLDQKRRRYHEDPKKFMARWKVRYDTNPNFRLAHNIRTRIRRALKSGTLKGAATETLIGCPFVWLEVHLESLFKPGMTWENQGSVWHIDHVKPCAKFDLSNPEQQRICFHWTNLQPLFAAENLKKGDKYVG